MIKSKQDDFFYTDEPISILAFLSTPRCRVEINFSFTFQEKDPEDAPEGPCSIVYKGTPSFAGPLNIAPLLRYFMYNARGAGFLSWAL